MFIKKDGSVLLITILSLSIISLIGCLCCKMMITNKQIQTLNYVSGDRYNLSEKEENALFDFMKKINNKIKHNKNDEISVEEIIRKDMDINIDGYELKYYDDMDKFVLCKNQNIDGNKYFGRGIDYRITNNDSEEIILIPTYIFVQGN